MSVLRIKKKAYNYVHLSKGFLEDPSISLKLKGFLAYCLSKPDDWVFYVNHLVKNLKEGRDAIYAIIDEGIKAGYIHKKQQKCEKGKFAGCDYEMLEEPDFQKISTVTDFPDTVSPEAENPELLMNYCTNELQEEVLSPNSQKKGEWGKQDEGTKTSFSNDSLTPFPDIETKDLENWRKDFPAVNVDKEIEKFRIWARDNPRDDYRPSLISWLTRVQTTHTTPSPEPKQPKETPPEDIETNRLLALGWEKEYGSLGGIHYSINASSTMIEFCGPGLSAIVPYDLASCVFHKLCVPHLKRLHHPKAKETL